MSHGLFAQSLRRDLSLYIIIIATNSQIADHCKETFPQGQGHEYFAKEDLIHPKSISNDVGLKLTVHDECDSSHV